MHTFVNLILISKVLRTYVLIDLLSLPRGASELCIYKHNHVFWRNKINSFNTEIPSVRSYPALNDPEDRLIATAGCWPELISGHIYKHTSVTCGGFQEPSHANNIEPTAGNTSATS